METGDDKRIAEERIKVLFKLAEATHASNPDRAQRYVDLARRIASRNRLHLPADLKRSICPGCKGYRGPSTSRTRIRQDREPHVAVTCMNCGHVDRIPLRRKKP